MFRPTPSQTTKYVLGVSSKEAPRGSGLFLSTGGLVFLGRRSSSVGYPNTWCIPGGRVESDDSSLYQTALRETEEEFGSVPSHKVTESWTNPENNYATFLCLVDSEVAKEWQPKANWEHDEFSWWSISALPSNLHWGVRDLLETRGYYLPQNTSRTALTAKLCYLKLQNENLPRGSRGKVPVLGKTSTNTMSFGTRACKVGTKK